MRLIDADKAIKVAQIKYNDWNLAMAVADGQREINLCFKKQELFKAVKTVLDCVPTLTPENEPLTIEQLREMDGEPVWLGIAGGVWGLIDTDGDCVWLDRDGSIDINKLAGKVYRYQPERQEAAK